MDSKEPQIGSTGRPSTCTARSMFLVFPVLLLVAAGCGTDEGRSNQSGSRVENFDEKRSEVERYKAFQPYYLGESFEGFALSDILHDRDPWRTVSFIYGDCEPPSGTDGGCAPPLEVQVAPACAHRPSSLAPVERFTIRGVPASGFSRHVEERVEGGPQTARDQDGRLELYTGWEVVTIFGGGQDRMRRAARALRRLSSDQVARKLPSPARDARDTDLTCREQAERTRP